MVTITKLKSACKSGMEKGEEGIIVDSCTFGSNRANDRHFHAYFSKPTQLKHTQPTDEWLHHNGYVCNNPKRWDLLPNPEDDGPNAWGNRHEDIEHCHRCAPNIYNVCFAEGCRCHVHDGQFKGGRLEKVKEELHHGKFWQELEVELDKAFPKDKCYERGAGLVLFAYAILLHKKYKNK